MHANNSQGKRLELLYGLRNFRLLMVENSRTGKKPLTFQAWCTVNNLSGSDNLAFVWGRSRSSRSNDEPSLRAQSSALTFLHRAQRGSWNISSRRTSRKKKHQRESPLPDPLGSQVLPKTPQKTSVHRNLSSESRTYAPLPIELSYFDALLHFLSLPVATCSRRFGGVKLKTSHAIIAHSVSIPLPDEVL
jgi:hypothetical protein